MDPELIEYLDRRFNELRDEFRSEIAASGAETRRYVDSAIVASAAETHRHFDSVIATTTAETRRHFDVVAERLMDKIQLVGEGVVGIDQKVDRLATETRAGFQKVDRRVLHLQARIIAPRG